MISSVDVPFSRRPLPPDYFTVLEVVSSAQFASATIPVSTVRERSVLSRWGRQAQFSETCRTLAMSPRVGRQRIGGRLPSCPDVLKGPIGRVPQITRSKEHYRPNTNRDWECLHGLDTLAAA